MKDKIEGLCQYMVREGFAKAGTTSDDLIKRATQYNGAYNRRLHFTFMFASPRYLELFGDNGYKEAYDEIDYTSEWDYLRKSLIE